MRNELARRLMFRLFAGIRDERLVVVENGRRYVFGPRRATLTAEVVVHSPAVWREVLRGSTGLAESYMDGLWETDDLVGLIRLGARNMHALDRARRRWHPVLRAGQQIADMVPDNDRAGSRRNISAHYDLGNPLFSLFLDPTMMYSCALFDSPDMTLEQAQLAKLERICQQLRLGPDDHLVEIGSGWGAMAVHAASRYGCRVTTTTISREQHELTSERVRRAGLEELVTVLLKDYRDLEGTYSKLVSIEMIEAVGWQYFDTYFKHCSELLEPDGLMLLQAITIDDRAYEVEKASKSFINTQIFPGGCLPSLEVIHRSLARHTDLRTVDLEDITEHYGETLLRWRERFLDSAARAGELGYDLRFRRMWELYLAYVEAGFRECRIGDVQILLAKPEWRGRLPLRSNLAGRLGTRIAGEDAIGDPIEEEAGSA
ncbi:MAG: class I SAM-dependent methyltransferase [Thermoleophilaceae bacterium]